MRGNAFRQWLPAAIVCTIAWAAVAPSSALAGGLAAIDAYHVGRHFLANGQREKALESFNDALRMNPQFVQAYVARGKLLAEMGQYPSALADLNFALHLQPTHAEGFAYRGFALLAMSRPDEALADLDTALRLDPKYARVHYLRSQTMRDLGNEQEAEVSLAAALQLDPTIEARQVIAAKHEAGADEGRIELASPTLPPERTSVLATNEADPPMDKRTMGNVVRFERHPFLAKLEAPAISQPRRPQTPPLDLQPRVGDRRGSSFPPTTKPAAAVEPKKLDDESKPSPEKVDGTAELATSPSLTIPQLESFPPMTNSPELPEATLSATEAAASAAANISDAKSELTPLPSAELPKAEVVTSAPSTEPVTPALPEIGSALPSVVEVPAATMPLPTVETSVPALIAPAPMEAVALPAAPLPIAPPVVELPVEAVPYVVADAPTNASAILADPTLADRLLSTRPAMTESERLSAALDAARQAALNRPEVVMSTQASPRGPVDMPVIEDMPGGEEMPVITDAPPMASATDAPAPSVAQAMPIVAENAVAMVSDAPAVSIESLIPPPVAPPVVEAPVAVPVAPAAAAPQFDVETKIALSQLDETLRQNPNDVRVRVVRGNLLLNHNAFDAAAADFDEALKLDPAQFEARSGRARARYLGGRYADAVDDFTAVLAADDHHAAALIERGHCLALLGKTADAERDRNAALALDPSLAKNGPKYGGSFAAHAPAPAVATPTSAFGSLFQGQGAAAPQGAENAVFVSDSSKPAVPEVVHAYAGDEVTPEAEIRALSAEIAKTPGDAKLYVRRAQAFSVLGQHQEVVDDLTAALYIDSECNVALVMRSRAYEAIGRSAEAQADQQRANQLMAPQQ